MVFESVLSSVLNKVLGDFVENLDTNQLNVGIWGGDVKLRNLVVKPSALNDLDLPVRTVYGTIGQLVLQIPWKNLYSSPTVVNVEDIYLLVSPNQEVQYDPEKEEKLEYELKRKEIQKVEDAKKAELEKDLPKADSTFVERLISNIIKNLQLTVKNIHIRYEDNVTNPTSPFSLGITLHQIVLESTDSNWQKAIVDDISKIYKVVQLDGLSVYWNCKTTLYGNIKRETLITNLKNEIASKTKKPKGYHYILGPINASARLIMNQKPENNTPAYSQPKIHLNLDMEKLYLGISRSQYRDLMALIDSMERMSKGSPYRKFRPNVPSYRGHYKEWWTFAYKSVLEGDVRRRKRDWDWNHISSYRDTCKEYKNLCLKKAENKMSAVEVQKLEVCEKKLHLTNIVIIRQQVEAECKRKEASKEKKGWFGWMWGSKSSEDSLQGGADIMQQFKQEMTAEEKQKLYKAIGYQESVAPVTYPEEYVDNTIGFLLRALEIELIDDEDQNTICVLLSTLKWVKCELDTRVAASALRVNLKIADFHTIGMMQEEFIPNLIVSEKGNKGSLLEIDFETNPLDKSCDQMVKIQAQPVKIIYDAQTINKLVDVFKVPPDTTLDSIQAAAEGQMSNVKEMTTTGIQYAIDKHIRLDVNIDLYAPHIIIPYGGKYTQSENLLIINLGHVRIFSYGERSSFIDLRRLYDEGKSQKEILQFLLNHCYDNFSLELDDLEVLMAQSDETWMETLGSKQTTSMHLLSPLSMSLTYSKCLITDDPKVPLTKISGNLPSIDIKVSEARLLLLIALITSIEFPTGDLPEPQPLTSSTKVRGSSRLLLKYKDIQQVAKQTKKKLDELPSSSKKDAVQFTTLEALFVMDEFCLTINTQEDVASEINKLVKFSLKSLKSSFVQRTYDTKISISLQSIDCQQPRAYKVVNVINTTSENSDCLFKVEFVQVDPKSPELHSTYKSCETTLTVSVGTLNVIFHQEALLSLMMFASNIQDNIKTLTETSTKDRVAYTRRLSSISEGVQELQKIAIQKTKRNIPVVVETIKFKLKAGLEAVNVKFETDEYLIALCTIRSLTATIIVKDTYTQINATLLQMSVLDLNPNTLHKSILSRTEAEEAFTITIVMYNLEGESNKPDIDVRVKIGGMKIFFLNYFITNLLDFISQFQAAQEKIIAASQAAVQSAKDNVKEVYTKATKIALSVHLKAPIVTVPVNSRSNHALLIDLGVLSLENKFSFLDVTNDDGYHAVVDDLNVNLTDLQVDRVELDDAGMVIKSCKLLLPLTFNLKVKRNLSASWYNSIPDMEISGKIKEIKLLANQGDYQLVMSILNQNLTEGQKPGEVVNRPQSLSYLDPTVEIELIPEVTRPQRQTSKAEKVHTFLQFTFAMEQFIIDLYTGGSLEEFDEKTAHDTDALLGRFSLQGLSLKGRIMTDDSMTTSVLLVNCILDDMRKGRENQLKRLIGRTDQLEEDGKGSSSTTASSLKSMIDVTYQQNETDMFADVRIYSFTIILSVDYLMQIADFFNAETEKVDPISDPKVVKSQLQVSSSKPNQRPAQVQPTERQITVNLKMEKPDIVLVEDMANLSTNAIILNSEIQLKLRMAGKHQVINGTMKDLCFYTCNFNPTLREQTKSNILDPVTISIAGSTPDNKGLHVELVVTEIHLSVSPHIIELLNRVMVTVTSKQGEEKDTSKEEVDHSMLWNETNFEDTDLWYLKTEYATDVLSIPSYANVAKQEILEEMCIISVPLISINIEAGVGSKTIPMLILETGLIGTARNWSTQLSVEARLTMLMGYYNNRLALWEPLIEPVEVPGKKEYVPWELKFEISVNQQEDSLVSPTSEESFSMPQPRSVIDVTSENNLELTVTKTLLEVLQNLGTAFSEAVKLDKLPTTKANEASYRVLNEIGEDITLILEDSSFQIAEGGSLEDINKSSAVPLQLKSEFLSYKKLQLKAELSVKTAKVEQVLHVKVNRKNCDIMLPVKKADKRFFLLNYRSSSGSDNWGIISDIRVDDGVTTITLRSILQVYNYFSSPIDIYYMTPKGNELELIGVAQPNGVLNVPLKAVYNPTNELFFAVPGYCISSTPYTWKDLQTKLAVTKILYCVQKDGSQINEKFIIKAVGEMEQVYYENTPRHTMASTCFNIHLRPAVVLKNFLPIDIVCCVDELAEEFTVKAGETLQLPSVDPGKNVLVIRLPEYLEKEWSSRQELLTEPPEFAVWVFHSYDSPTRMSLDLGMHTLNKGGSLIMSLYCPFWMLNKTGVMLAYRKSKKTEKREAEGSPAKTSDEHLNVLHHPPQFKGPILFSFNARNFFGKKKASIRVETGNWSDKFSIDVAGSSGVVSCKANDMIYQIGVWNKLTQSGLTKQITFVPYYVIINNAPFTIECQENDRPADHWLSVEPNSCSALWPKSEMTDKLLRLRVHDTKECSPPFLYTESHTTLLRLNNKYGGVNVDIQLSEGGVCINLAPYEHGSAPALLINHTSIPITYWEKNSVQKRTLQPHHQQLYTWENPSGSRVFAWDRGHNKEIFNELKKDIGGEFSPDDVISIFWGTFLDGMQRVLLFTEDRNLVESAGAANLLVVFDQEINVSIQGVGISLVNNSICQEIMYIGIASSGIIWETGKLNSTRYKQLETTESTHIENAYKHYLTKEQFERSSTASIAVSDKLEIDFLNFVITKPNKRKLRRTFQTGLWFQMKSCPNQMQIHAKINRLQIDNQMYDCIFPVVLAPVPPPKSVAADSGIKPFMEVSIVQLLMKNSQIRQYKYFKVLIQEFHIKVDLGFVNAIVDLLQQSEQTDEQEKEQFLKDMNFADEALYSLASTIALQEQKSFYDLLHFSPIKVHISFSMASGTTPGQNAATPNFLNVLLQGLGVTLTDLQDVVFKLAYFERDYTFLTQNQLISEATTHYIGQAVKQLYVLVLGLDVLGNPYGLVVGISKGVEDLFYEPFQGAIQGPGEFAEGLALGVKSLFGHTVGGAAGAMSRITGAMGKGIAALTFDDEFQRKRREQMNRKAGTVHEGFARSGKGLVMGVVSGVTGVVTKPISGAKEDGVEGFFKGLGKGAVGLVARPMAGVVDFASGSLDAVKRATDAQEDVSRLRPPRVLHCDGVVKPYHRLEAEGNKILKDVSKGKYAKTDSYVAHYTVIANKEILLLTDQRLAYVTKNDIFGGWQMEWFYTWGEIVAPPKVVPKGILISTSEKKKKLFGSSDVGKTILIGDPAKKEEICVKIESLRSA